MKFVLSFFCIDQKKETKKNLGFLKIYYILHFRVIHELIILKVFMIASQLTRIPSRSDAIEVFLILLFFLRHSRYCLPDPALQRKLEYERKFLKGRFGFCYAENGFV